MQTEQDKARLLDGLSAAAGGVDVAAMSATIAGLDKREFVLRQAGKDRPTTFTSRWAMSYLRGPLTREQITTLMADRRSRPVTAEPVGDTSPPADAAPTAPSPALAEDATPVMPTVAEGVAVRWLDPAAPWATQVGAVPTSTRFAAAIVATVDLLFDDTKADLRHTEQAECVLFPLGDPPDVASLVAVDHDPRDLRPAAPSDATYELPVAKLSTKALFTTVQRTIVEHLLATRTVTLFSNRELKLVSRPGESQAEFAARCDVAADAGADAQVAVLAKRFESKIERARAAVATAQDRVRQAEAAQSTKQTDELVTGAGDLLGAVFGGRGGARTIARKVGGLATRRSRTSEAGQRVETASNRVEEKAQALADLEADMAAELAAIGAAWDEKALAIETLDVPLEKSDIRVSSLALVWIPV